MNMIKVLAAAEFRSRKRDLPVPLIRFLMCITIIYGIFLTLTLPWNLSQGILDAGPWGQLGVIGNTVFATLLVFTMVRWCVVHPVAFIGFHGILGVRPARAAIQPFVSILVPACNEAETVHASIRSLIELDYPHFEVIVIDDGSKDATYAIAKPHEGDYGHCKVKVFSKPNGGKWAALNFGFAQSMGELLLCVDADLIRALTGKHPIRPTSPRFRRSRRLEPGRRSTYPPKNLFRQAEPPHPDHPALTAFRQKLHLSRCSDLQSQLSKSLFDYLSSINY